MNIDTIINKKSLSSLTWTREKNLLLDTFESSDPSVQLKIANFFFFKMYSYYKLPFNTRESMLDYLKSSLSKTRSSLYLRWRDDYLLRHLCLHFFDHRIHRFVNQLLNDRTLITTNSLDMNLLKEHFLEWFDTLNNYHDKSNMLEVLLNYFHHDPRVQDIHIQLQQQPEKKNNTIYDNGQNVHDSTIHQSMMEAAGKLVHLYKKKHHSINWVKEKLKNLHSKDLDNVLERCNLDGETFTIEMDISTNETFTLADTLCALVQYIIESPHKVELMSILDQEIQAMARYCASGHLSRMLNVLQGFDKRFVIRIGFIDQLYSVVSFAVAKAMNEDDVDDNVIEGTYIEEQRPYYLDFIKSFIERNQQIWIDDYGYDDVLLILPDVLKKLTKEKWIVQPQSKTSFTLKVKK